MNSRMDNIARTQTWRPPVEILNPAGAGQVVILCEHASSFIPAEYKGLGLAPEDRQSHAAWDPGALALSEELSAALDAPVVAGKVSRLVYDCNRPPDVASAMPEKSERVNVSSNIDLSVEERRARTEAVYDPYCAAVSEVLDARGPDTMLVTAHSFTPVYFGQRREVELGLLHDSDSRLVGAMLSRSHELSHRRIARNLPYGPEDGVTHSLKLHALSRGLANVMIEVRNDLLSAPEDISRMCRDIVSLLAPSIEEFTMKENVTWPQA